MPLPEIEEKVRAAVQSWWDDYWSRVGGKSRIGVVEAEMATAELQNRLQARGVTSIGVFGTDVMGCPTRAELCDRFLERITEAEINEEDLD